MLSLVSMEITTPSSEVSSVYAARRALECLASALQVLVTWHESSESIVSAASITGVITTRHPFASTTTAVSHCVGFVGCARAICHATLTSSTDAVWNERVEAWMESAVNTLLPLWTTTSTTTTTTTTTNGGVTAEHYHHRQQVLQQAVRDYSHHIDRYLFQQDLTYLVGDSITAADVCVALWLLQASVELKMDTLPQQCHRWLTTLLQHDLVQSFVTVAEEDWPSAADAATTSSHTKSTSTSTATSATFTTTTTTTTTTTSTDEPLVTTTETTTDDVPITATTTVEATATASTTATVTIPPATTTDDDGANGDTAAAASLQDNPIVALLRQQNLEHEVYTHAPCVTAEELVQKVPIPANETHTKNLLLRDKKHGLVLLVVAPSTAVNTKDIGTYLKLPAGTKTNFRLADEATLMKVLQCRPGCLGPLCLIHDDVADHQITHLLVDSALLSNNGDSPFVKIHSHPMRNDASVKVTPKVLLEFWKTNGIIEPTIVDFASAAAATSATSTPAAAAAKTPKPPKAAAATAAAPSTTTVHNKDKKVVKKGETLLALQWKKDENFAMWYSDVIVLSEMIAYYDISGCYILRPWSYKIWELVQEWFNAEIRALGVENAYFPLFVSQERLEREKDHVEGFAPEVAWVTKSGDGELAKPIAIRPTSETIMYPAFSDWIQSHRDLPLLLNQWSNVVRWEFKDPTPFLRSREFLWQEGHTAHSSFDEANTMVRAALELYRRVYEELLAVPVIPGYKTEKEKFAGGHTTTTVEAYIAGSGRAIQGATSHHLGQNFGKMFDITFQDEHGQTQTAWQTSWGLTTRTIGVMVMVHGDDTGLVLPPRIAPLQIVIVPIISNKKLTNEQAKPYCQDILQQLQQVGIRAKYDDRAMYNPGWKYNHWEQKGVPLRIEVGPRDIEQQQVRVVVRYSGEKFDLNIVGLAEALQQKLQEIQAAMLEKARAIRDQHVVQVTEWKDVVPNLELNHLVLTPWCGGEHQEWEEWVKATSREESLKARGEGEEDARTSTSVAAKSLCIPFNQPELPEGTKCIASGLPATCWILWGRSY